MEDWKQLQANNKLIHEFMERQPEIEYCIGAKDGSSIRYSPSQCYFDSAYTQKKECERWLNENNGKPQAKDQAVLKLENYPYYNKDWNLLMEVIEKIQTTAHVNIRVGYCCISRKFIDKMSFAKAHNMDTTDVPLLGESNSLGFIGNVYEAVLQFINWYNNEKSPKIATGIEP